MYYTQMDTVVGKIVIAGNDEGLKFINFQRGKHPIPIEADWKEDPAFLKMAVDQLKAYFSGELKEFNIDLSPDGTLFQKSVWKALMTVPYGKTASYKDIAEAVGNPKSVRPVGGANGQNPIPIIIPCHRIIGADGKLVGYAGGLDIKKRLLNLEKDNYF